MDANRPQFLWQPFPWQTSPGQHWLSLMHFDWGTGLAGLQSSSAAAGMAATRSKRPSQRGDRVRDMRPPATGAPSLGLVPPRSLVPFKRAPVRATSRSGLL